MRCLCRALGFAPQLCNYILTMNFEELLMSLDFFKFNMILFSAIFWVSLSLQAQAQTESTELGQPAPAPFTKKVSRGNTFNPEIGANLLGLYQRGTGLSDDRTVVPHNGFSLQEAEIQFSADVDPYLRASALLAISQEDGGTEYMAEPEEIYVETLQLPGFTVKAGKFKLALGKQNQLHTHALPFIDGPLIHDILLGGEGLNESGVSLAYLVPLSWYSEIQLQAFSLNNEELFNSQDSGDMGGLVHLKNLWDLSDSLTFEMGLSGATGKNQFDENSSVYGADLTFKWRPVEGGKYQAVVWSTEYLAANRKGLLDAATGESLEELGGIATWIQYQFAQRWWIQARHEAVGLPRPEAIPSREKQSALIGFFPSEFSGIRFQYDRDKTLGAPTDHTFSLQYNVSIGAHPAHMY